MYIDAYKLLKIEKTDDQQVIRRAYKESAKENHPDKAQIPEHLYQCGIFDA